MRIDYLFSNFKCFENYRLVFLNGINQLLGENGSGKTMILRGMKIAISSFFSVFLNEQFIYYVKYDIQFKTAE